MTGDVRYEKAVERVEELKGFYIHLAVYVIVNLGLFVIDALSGNGWWFYWATIGWGFGVLIHAVTLLLSGGRVSRWEQRKIEDYLNETPTDRDYTGAR